ncbi:MAG: type II toxin-antitoxin system YafQ family toxin [Coriobacteriia bacterium]|nr:type II toxin-antitoxin system YafQ family toxin [Coriobacteriia bacterium]
MKYQVKLTGRFRKEYKRAVKRGLHIELLDEIITQLAQGKPLDAVHRDHALIGNYAHHRECHIQPDWLLVYRIEEDILTLTLTRTGTHSDLF